MSKPRVTATDQLSNVIEVVELGQRTGLLSVERGSGSVLEEGEIYFVAGRAVYAALGGLRGRDALAALSRWGACRFAFDKDAPRPVPNLTNPQQPAIRPPASQPGPASDMGSSWPFAQSQPGQMPSPSSPAPADGSASWPRYAGGSPGGGGAERRGPAGGNATYGPQPGATVGAIGNLGGGQRAPYPGEGGQAGYGQAGTSNAALMRRPRRAPDVRDLMMVVNTHNLTRGHRTVLLLADGEHTVLDLARLSSKSPDEVLGLLEQLESRGLIYYYE